MKTVYRAMRVILSLAVRTGKYHGSIGRIGRHCGRILGWPLACSDHLRILVDDPHEGIQGEMLARGVYEPEIVEVLGCIIRPGDLFFDIGANIGCHTLIGVNYGADVHAFEPVPRLAHRLRRNVQVNRLEHQVRVVEAALSNSVGTSTFYLVGRADDGSHSLLAGVPAQSSQPITVQTTTVDDYMRLTGCPVPAVMKIDVEGAEALVLEGATSLLAENAPPIIILETGQPFEATGEGAAGVVGRLLSLGYRVFRIPESEYSRTVEVGDDNMPRRLGNYVCIPHASPRLDLFLDRFVGQPHERYLVYLRLMRQTIRCGGGLPKAIECFACAWWHSPVKVTRYVARHAAHLAQTLLMAKALGLSGEIATSTPPL
jgi:FkbM family methyltransferase